MHDTRKIVTAAAILALACGLLLSSANILLKERIASNRRMELCRRILATISLKSAEPEQAFRENFVQLLVFEDEKVVHHPAEKILAVDFKATRYALLPRQGAAAVVHLVGKGLWGEIRGFAALQQDLTTLQGLSFYQSNETPGLGAQFSEPEVLERFQNRKVDNSFRIVKKGEPTDEFSIDGISGATITGKSIEKILKRQVEFYRSHIKRRAE